MSDDSEIIDAGPFGEWFTSARRVLQGRGESDVPCGTCTGCCTSSYYIRIRAADRAAVTGIASSYFVRGRGMPPDEVLMGWRHDGTCPALESTGCSVYAQRPMTCRDYDCRIFAAAGIEAGDERKTVINERVRAWRFRFESDEERHTFDAIRRAARFIQERVESFPGGGRGVPTAPTGIAVLAIKASSVFLDPKLAERDDVSIANAVIEASREFDAEAQTVVVTPSVDR
ncbi:MAG: YkgJ family cysteine cluster protein [Steroidobacteraceae bacterium]